MIDFFDFWREEIIHSIKELKGVDRFDAINFDSINFDAIVCEPCKNPDHGDLATNAALVMAGHFKTSPQILAKKIYDKIAEFPNFSLIKIAGPGFINLRLENIYWHSQLIELVDDKFYFPN